MPTKEKVRGKKRRVTRYRVQWGVGISYLYGAAGIDDDGDLPAAYEHTELSFPFSLKYRI